MVKKKDDSAIMWSSDKDTLEATAVCNLQGSKTAFVTAAPPNPNAMIISCI